MIQLIYGIHTNKFTNLKKNLLTTNNLPNSFVLFTCLVLILRLVKLLASSRYFHFQT